MRAFVASITARARFRPVNSGTPRDRRLDEDLRALLALEKRAAGTIEAATHDAASGRGNRKPFTSLTTESQGTVPFDDARDASGGADELSGVDHD